MGVESIGFSSPYGDTFVRFLRALMTNPDPFLHQRILDLTDTPMQRKLRKMAPMPVGAVFLPWPGMTEEEAREQFRTMKEVGFTCLKQTMGSPEWPRDRVFHAALDEGIIPFWYAEAGWEEIIPELLEKLGLDPAMDIDDAMEHPKVIEYQTEIIRKQIDSQDAGKALGGKAIEKKSEEKQLSVEEIRARSHIVPSVVGAVKGHELDPEIYPQFIEWLKEQYGDVETLKKAWNVEHVGLSGKLRSWESWEDVMAGLDTDVGNKEYRHYRDMMRFRADTFIESAIKPKIELQKITDPNIPLRSGGEMGIFLPFASRGTDMEGIARAMAEGGSFYPSIHLTWHFEEAHYEVARPVYMQAAMTSDWAKGIWSATWESSGGPSWFSGGKSPFVEWAQDKPPGFTCHEGTQTILMLSWLAGGYRGFGLWTWNQRTAGWECGEFGLVDRNRKLTERARRAGAIGKAAKKYRRELWESDKQPEVGVLQCFDNEAMWAAMGVTGRDMYKSQPIRARMGASRALINGNIPWEHVTPRQLADGLGPRYQTIYLPAFLSLGTELLEMLIEYVEQGGRVVMDLPSAYIDDYGRLLYTEEGTLFEKLFGVVLHEYGYSRTINNTYTIGDVELEGFTASLTPTTAKILATYSDQGGAAITENRLGKGTAVFLGAEASLGSCLPGNDAMEGMIRDLCTDGRPRLYNCDGAIVYRLVSPKADHYFLINDQAAREVQLLLETDYTSCSDAITGESLDLTKPLALEREGGRWVRCEK